MEIWKEIEGYPNYEVSSFGNVRSIKTNVVLKERFGRGGYRRTQLYKDGKSKFVQTHRLVAQAFIPNPENKLQVNHIDGNKVFNHISNLEWNTPSENQKHSFKIGLALARKGESCNFAKLTEKLVIDLRSAYATGFYTQKELATKFGVSYQTIHLIVRRKTWNHI